MHFPIPSSRIALAALAACALPAVAVAHGTGRTTVKAGAPYHLVAPTNSPIDFPGAPKARAGKALPAGYAVTARTVRVTRGSGRGAPVTLTCRGDRALVTLGTREGSPIVMQLAQKTSYAGKRSVHVYADAIPRKVARGATARATLYALCR